MSTISPTPGRVVWYYPSKDDPLQSFSSVAAGKPLAAHVAHVWSDTCINLMVIDPNGNPTSRTSVLLHQADSERPNASFAEWMPYQKGQAAKTEATQADSHASRVLYPAIEAAMKELGKLQPGFNVTADRAFNHLHQAFWSECPAPASAAPLRPLPDTAEA